MHLYVDNLATGTAFLAEVIEIFDFAREIPLNP